MRRLVAIAVLLSLGATACGGADPSSIDTTPTDATPRASDPPRTSEGDDPVDASPELAASLAATGIRLGDWPTTPLAPTTGIELSGFQVDAMQHQLDTGAGFLGASLDEMTGAPGGMPVSYLLAGWMVARSTPAAADAADLMGDQPWEQAPALVFPSVVLTMFAADAALAAEASGVQGLAAPIDTGPFMLASMSGSAGSTLVCSALADWFGSILDFLFDALKADTDGLFGFLAEIWNAAVDLARATIGGLIEVLTAPIVAAVAEVIGVIGTLSMVASLLVPWSAELTESDPRPHFAVGDAPDIAQRFTLTIDTNLDVEWPGELEDCAAVAGFDLPDPGEAVGSPVAWVVEGLPTNGAETTSDSTLDDENEAAFDWVTGREPVADGDEVVGVVSATATSTQIEELRSMLQQLLAGFVPVAPIGDLVAQLFVDLAGPVFDQFATLVQVSGATSVRVVHHEEPEPEATVPVPTTEPETIDLTDVDPCSLLSVDEAALPLLTTPTETRNVGEAVSLSGLGAIGCRYTGNISERVGQHLSLGVTANGAGHLDDVAAWNPWGDWDIEPLAGVGDDARLVVSNGSNEYASPAGTIYAVVAIRNGVLVRAGVSNDAPASPDGLITIVNLVFDRLGA